MEFKFSTLIPEDLNAVVLRLPWDIRRLLETKTLFVAGGFIRATIAGERPSDIDLFGPSKASLEEIAKELAEKRGARLHKTDNAFTILSPPRLPVQFIHRWTYTQPIQVAKEFDFTVCQAVIWHEKVEGDDKGRWYSICSEDFYADLARKRLRYTAPDRVEDAGGSLLRVIKYLGRGYHISPESLARVVARLAGAVRWNEVTTEAYAAQVIAGLLREVDPLVIVDGVELRPEHVDEGGAEEPEEAAS